MSPVSNPVSDPVSNPVSYNAVIFDMDGLLVDSERLSYESYVATATRYGLASDFEPYTALIGLNHVEGIPALQALLPASIDPRQFKEEWVEAYRGLLAQHVPVKPYALQLVQALAAIDIPMAVATSSRGEKARETLDRIGILPYLIGVTGGNEVPRGKPAPDVYLASLEKIMAHHKDVSAASVMALEDSETGTNAAIAASLRVIQVPDLVPAKRPPSPTHLIVSDLRDAGALLGVTLAAS